MAKRANGEGTIYQRADGRWCAAVTGERGQRKYVYGATRREVGRKLNEAIRQRDDGMPMLEERQTVAEFFPRWLDAVRPTIAPRTSQRYESLVRLYIIPGVGRIALARLTPQRLQLLYTQVSDSGLAPATVRQIHAVLHRALKQATHWNLAARNVADLVRPPRVRHGEMTTLAPEDARKLLRAASGERLEALYVLALTTGMRQGELLGLRWEDVDLDAKSIHVRHTLQRMKGLVLADTKTAHSRRAIHLSDIGASAMQRHRQAQDAERERAGAFWEDLGFVFATELGTPIDAGNLVHRSFPRLLARAGLPRMRFHDLRHSAATLLLGEGIHPKIVSEMLGHSQIGITLDLYSHATPTIQHQATEAMDRLFP